MNRNNIILITIAIITLLVLVIGATYAYFATGNLNITNVVNANTVTEQNNMIFDTLGGGMILNITAANMVEVKQGNVAAENNTTLTVNFTANTDYSMVCTYDIVYEWTSSDKYTIHTSGVTANEFTVQGTLASNAHVSEGTNSIANETDLSTLTYTNYAATVVSGAQIDGTGSTTSTAVWTLSSKFYNVNADQSTLSGKTYAGKFRVANVSCIAGTVSGGGNTIVHLPVPEPESYWFDYETCTSEQPCEFPESYGGDPIMAVFVGMDSSKYYACHYNYSYSDAQVCLSQPYTQYGLAGHVRGTYFTSAEQERVMQILYQVYVDAGVESDLSCNSDAEEIYCSHGAGFCSVYYNGNVKCQVDGDIDKCVVDYLGRAYCEYAY